MKSKLDNVDNYGNQRVTNNQNKYSESLNSKEKTTENLLLNFDKKKGHILACVLNQDRKSTNNSLRSCIKSQSAIN